MTGTSSASPTQRLVDHALALAWARLPPMSRGAARRFLHDTLCVGAAGRKGVHADSVLDMVRAWGTGSSASVLGRSGTRLPPASAAFVNAYQIHNQEFDCVHEAAVLHPMATVVSALLAEAERGAAVTGAQLLAAIVAGVDVAVTLGLAATGPLTFFRPATAGIFGSVAAIANVRRMDRQVALDAFGHALSFASGTMQAHGEGKPALPVQVANAARGALVAVDLARAGMAGVAAPIEGPFGYMALLERDTGLDAALDELGQGHRIDQVSWKPFPTGRAAHGGIVAIQKMMRDFGVSAGDVHAIDYHAPPLIQRLVGRPAVAGMESGYARLCLPWLAAVTLKHRTVDLSDFSAECLANTELFTLAKRVTVVADGNPDPAAFVPGRATARLRDGRTLHVEVATQLGSPEWPLTLDQHREKARGCLVFAGLGDIDDVLFTAIETLDQSSDAVATIRATGIFG